MRKSNPMIVLKNEERCYTYGKGVMGELTLKAESNSHFYSELTPKIYEFKTKIDGSVDIPINLVSALSLPTNYDDYHVLFTAEVTEQHTGRKYNSSATIRLFEHELNVKLIKLGETFKPGLPYNCLIKISYRDDTPLAVKEDDYLTIYYGDSYQEELWTKLEAGSVPETGIMNVEIPAMRENITILAMKAVFRGIDYYLPAVQSAVSPSSNYIRANLVSVDQENAEIEVGSTEPLSYLVYQVVSRGNIVSSLKMTTPSVTKYTFKIPVVQSMAPKATVLIYYIRKENNELIADAINFKVNGVFRTPVTLKTNTDRTKPGNMVDIDVETKPNAFVGILAVDQSVLLLKSGNDISQNDVMEELETYDAGKKRPEFHYARKRRSLWWSGSSTAAEIFQATFITRKKWQAIGRMEAGQSQAEVARWLGVTRNVVSRLWKKFQTTANFARTPGQGRPRVTTLNQDRYLSLLVRRNRRMTASQLRSDLNAATGVLVSTDTIRRRLHKKGLYARRPIICVPLTPPQKRARKLWCRQHVAWNPNEWRRVMFTDESRFSLNSDSSRVFVWREVGTRNNPRNMVERDPYRSQGFMVWAGIFLGGRTALHIFRQGTLTGQRYRDEILAAYVMPQAFQMGENFILIDDNARPQGWCGRHFSPKPCNCSDELASSIPRPKSY
ncbi:CD109 [Cordylochernes scorpioides]|uniref:CD109 n=1 Tax=Cordylochernes scorpioides TaxID=51811 RepID=A0ABY6LVN5_9ARAC|nr:CD109 [Cordylochernes scorpioides]